MLNDTGRVTLGSRGRRRFLGGHPWIYADDLSQVEAEPGGIVAIVHPRGELAGWGLYSSASRIAVRALTRRQAPPDRAFFAERLERAVALREREGLLDPAGACRLVHGDADGFPGLVVDRYGAVLVLQSGTQGSDRLRDLVAELLQAALPFAPCAVLDRSDASVRRLEELEPRVELLAGELPAELVVVEEGLAYEVDVRVGHKTGHYLDQRENRLRAAALVRGGRVLDAFSYDGLFGIRAALAGAASVLCIDQSQEAGERCRRNAERNGVAARVRFERANAMKRLRDLARGDEAPFELAIVDPPAFARNRREVEGAERGYLELNRRALALVAPGGVLVSASCSHAIAPEHFTRILGAACHRAERPAWLLALSGAGRDHPHLLTLPESAYLKCAFLRLG